MLSLKLRNKLELVLNCPNQVYECGLDLLADPFSMTSIPISI